MDRSAFALTRYDRCERSGRATLTFEREIDGVVEEREVERCEPSGPQQDGWTPEVAATILAARPRDEMIFDGLFVQATRATFARN